MSIIEKDIENLEIVDSSEFAEQEIREELAPEGLYYKNEDGSQGFVPRAKENNYWGFTEEQEIQKNRWVREAMLDFPKADKDMVNFLMCFYMKYPDKYEEIMKKSKDKPARTDSIQDLRKKYVEVDKYNNVVFDAVDDDLSKLIENNTELNNEELNNLLFKNE